MSDYETKIKRKIRMLRQEANDTDTTEYGNIKYRILHETANDLADMLDD